MVVTFSQKIKQVQVVLEKIVWERSQTFCSRLKFVCFCGMSSRSCFIIVCYSTCCKKGSHGKSFIGTVSREFKQVHIAEKMKWYNLHIHRCCEMMLSCSACLRLWFKYFCYKRPLKKTSAVKIIFVTAGQDIELVHVVIVKLNLLRLHTYGLPTDFMYSCRVY